MSHYSLSRLGRATKMSESYEVRVEQLFSHRCFNDYHVISLISLVCED